MNDAVISVVKQAINSGIVTMPVLARKAGVTGKHLHEVLEGRKAGSLALWSGVAKGLGMAFRLVPVVNGGLFDEGVTDDAGFGLPVESVSMREFIQEVVRETLGQAQEPAKPWHGAKRHEFWIVQLAGKEKPEYAQVVKVDNQLVFAFGNSQGVPVVSEDIEKAWKQ